MPLVVRCLSCDGCCLLFVVYVLIVVCCLLFAVCCLFVACLFVYMLVCLLCGIVCGLLVGL